MRWMTGRGAVLMALLAAALASAGAAAAKECKAVAGDFTSALVPPPECRSATGLCTRGTLTGDLRATYDFAIATTQPDPSVSARLLYAGSSVITRTHGGAQLFGQDTGFMDTANPLAVPFVTTVNIVGGTKQFSGAAGQIVASGTLNFVTGEAVGSYTGEICKHAARR